MPITLKKGLNVKTRDEFHDIAEIILNCAFRIHNEYGRFCPESVYKNLLVYFLKGMGVSVDVEFSVELEHNGFKKYYFIDLLVSNGVPVELKAVENFCNAHKQQLINYLFLSSLPYGLLINFGAKSVEKYYCSSSIACEERFKFQFNFDEWDTNIKGSELCISLLGDILKDWGIFLDFNVYKDALIYFMGEKSQRDIDIVCDSTKVGKQKFILLNETTALHFSGVSSNIKNYRKHVHRLIHHTNLNAVQWINFNKRNVKLTTIKK